MSVKDFASGASKPPENGLHADLVDLRELPEDYLLTPEEAAAAIGVQKETLANWRSTARISIPYVKIGKRVRYRAGSILRYIREHTFENTGEAL